MQRPSVVATSRSTRLSRQLAGATFVFAILLCVLLTAADYNQTQRRDREHREQWLELLADSALQPIANAVWNYNTDALQLFVDGIARQPDVVYVAVHDVRTRMLSKGESSDTLLIRELPLLHTRPATAEKGRTEEIGKLVIGIDQAAASQRTLEAVSRGLVSNLVLVCCIVGFLMLIIERQVMRHLRVTSKFVVALDRSNLHEHLQLDRPSRHGSEDELDLLVSGLNKMQDGLCQSIATLEDDIRKREAVEAEVRRLNADLEHHVKERTHQLQQARASAEQVLDLTGSAHWMLEWTGEGPSIASSPRLEKLLGLPSAEQHRLDQILEGIAALSPNDARRFESLIRELYTGRCQEAHVTFPFQRPCDNAGMWLDALAVMATDLNGPPRITGSLQDVTARKATEAALNEVKEQADAALRTKSEFLADMSREIRTPINAVCEMCNVMLGANLTAKQEGYVLKIRQAGEHLLGIIDNTLDLSKIESGKQTLESTDFELDSVLDHVANLVGDKAAEKGLELTFQIAPEVPRRLCGDPLRLSQILVNYGNNAVKLTDRGEVRVRVALDRQSGEQVVLRFTVTDSGIGLEPEQIARLLASFEQAGSLTTYKYGGSDLGLVISKRLAEMMGGQVGVDSVPGQGSSVWFTARLSLAASCAPGPRVDPALRHSRILLVEDSLLNQQVATEMLTDAGLIVELAENGARAIEMAGQHDYDAILMDIQMPVMDGITATRLLRAAPKTQDLPIIAMTANVMEEDRQRYLKVGMTDLIAKPIDPHTLFRILAANLEPLEAHEAPVIPPVVDDGPLTELPLYIEGIDLKVGRSRLMGSDSRYARYLRLFAEHSVELPLQLQTALDARDLAGAQRLAHTLKGSAGQIGAEQVRVAAEAFEKAVTGGASTAALTEMVSAITEVLIQTVNGIYSALPPQSASSRAEGDCGKIIGELSLLIENDDAKALSVFEGHRALLEEGLGPVDFKALAGQLQQFDFGQALETLRKHQERQV